MGKLVLRSSEIEALIPNAYPVLLDRVEIDSYSCGVISNLLQIKSIHSTGFKVVTEEFGLNDTPALQLEAAAQVASVLVSRVMRDNSDIFPTIFTLTSAKSCEFIEQVVSGDTLRIAISTQELDSDGGSFSAHITCEDETISKFQFSLAFEYELERSLCIIKPDAVRAGQVEQIIAALKANYINIATAQMNGNTVALRKKKTLNANECLQLYAEHASKPFYPEIQDFMTSGDCVVCVVEGPEVDGMGCIQRYRNIMGETDPAKALPGTIRSFAGSSKGENAIHGSDSPEASAREIPIFFPEVRFWSSIPAF